ACILRNSPTRRAGILHLARQGRPIGGFMSNRAHRTALFFVLAMSVTVPLSAQIDLSGQWAGRIHHDQNERGLGPDLGDYSSLPINEAARYRAQAYSASLLTLPEWQCRPHPADYMAGRAGFNIRLTPEYDPQTQQIIAWRHHVAWMAQDRIIWMDGRPHPPEDAAHTWQGFS